MKHKLLPIAAVIAALVLAYFALDWAMGALIHSRKAVTVPDLTGKTVAEALDLLNRSKLGMMKEGDQFDKRFPAGVIIRQSPGPGVGAREGRAVRVTLSQGGETLYVPDVIGQPLREAQTQLQNFGFGVGEVEHKPSLRFEKDVVMGSDPPARAVASKSALVSLMVSDGPPDSDVMLAPDFTGRTLGEVKKWAAAHQVTVSVREDNDIARGAGEILQQFPAADAPISAGDTLNVVANSGTSDEVVRGRVRYDLPPGGGDRDVRVLVIDEAGEREVYRRSHPPGSRVEFAAEPRGRARARIFVNGIMVEEQELQ